MDIKPPKPIHTGSKSASAVQKPGLRRKRIIRSLVAVVIIFIGVGGVLLFRANSILNSITGNNQNVFRTFEHLLARENTQLANEDGRTNIAVLGIRGKNDPHGGLLADAIMIISLNEPTKEIALISMPRDLRAEVPGMRGYRKLNSLNGLGENRDLIEGLELTKSALADITGMEIHYGITLDFEGFKGIIDALGGITVNAAEDFHDPNYDGGITVTQGPTYMDSEKAHKYVWARLTTNDFDRARRQREVINGMKDKAEEKGALRNPLFLLNVLDTLGDNNLKTTMQVEEMKAALREMSKYNLDEMIEKGYDTSLDGPLTSYTDPVAGYLIVPRANDWSELQEDIQSIFTPNIPDEMESVNNF